MKLEKTPLGARLKRKAASFYELCSQEEESARVELLKYEEKKMHKGFLEGKVLVHGC